MSFTCGVHGWQHLLKPCPVCQTITHAEILQPIESAETRRHKELITILRRIEQKLDGNYIREMAAGSPKNSGD